jgi:hypothetical protein
MTESLAHAAIWKLQKSLAAVNTNPHQDGVVQYIDIAHFRSTYRGVHPLLASSAPVSKKEQTDYQTLSNCECYTKTIIECNCGHLPANIGPSFNNQGKNINFAFVGNKSAPACP